MRSVVDCCVATVNLVYGYVGLASRKQLLSKDVHKAHLGAARVFWTRKLNNCAD